MKKQEWKAKDKDLNENGVVWFRYLSYTAQKRKFSIEDFFSKCDKIRRFLPIWSYLLKKSLMGNFNFCAVSPIWKFYCQTNTAWEVSIFGVFLVRIFLHRTEYGLNTDQTEYGLNQTEYGPEKLQIGTLFTSVRNIKLL